MKVSELLATLETTGIVKRAYFGYANTDDFTSPYEIDKIKNAAEFIDFRISDVIRWSIEPGMYETFLCIRI